MNDPHPIPTGGWYALGVWCSQALTEFIEGALAGITVGVGVGGAAVSQTDSLESTVLTLAAAKGILLAMAVNGVKHFVVWHSNNHFPNPFLK